jgi:hypothetical protein
MRQEGLALGRKGRDLCALQRQLKINTGHLIVDLHWDHSICNLLLSYSNE